MGEQEEQLEPDDLGEGEMGEEDEEEGRRWRDRR